MMTIIMAKSVEVYSQLAGVDHDMAAQIFRNSRLEPMGDMTKKNPGNFTVFRSFLERGRDRFRLFVPKRYCVPTRSFLTVPDRSSFLTVPDRSSFLTVPDRS